MKKYHTTAGQAGTFPVHKSEVGTYSIHHRHPGRRQLQSLPAMAALQSSPLSSNSFSAHQLAPCYSPSPPLDLHPKSCRSKKFNPRSHLVFIYPHSRRRRRLNFQLFPRQRTHVFKVKTALVETKSKATELQVLSAGQSSTYSSSSVIGKDSNENWDRTDDMQAEARAMARAAGASTYSPELLSTKYGSRPLKVVQRTLDILLGLGSFAFSLLLDQQNGKLDTNKRLRAVELRTIFTNLGPTFVKFGQGLSTRPDICPPEYLEELSELQG